MALRACIACQAPMLVKLLGSMPGLERLLLKGHSNHRCSEARPSLPNRTEHAEWRTCAAHQVESLLSLGV